MGDLRTTVRHRNEGLGRNCATPVADEQEDAAWEQNGERCLIRGSGRKRKKAHSPFHSMRETESHMFPHRWRSLPARRPAASFCLLLALAADRKIIGRDHQGRDGGG